MGILINRDSRVVVVGMTGRYGSKQTEAMIKYGTGIVAGVTPGRGGESLLGVPVFDRVSEAVQQTGANSGIIYVRGLDVKEAAFEAIEAGLDLLVIATENVPVQDTMEIRHFSRINNCWVVGPNSIGIINPGETLIGSLGPSYAKPGPVGLISRSGTLSVEITRILSGGGLGQSTCVSMGGDTVIGRNPVEYLKKFEEDPQTEIVVLVGEIGGLKENEVAEYIVRMSKPVVGFIAGRSVPPGKRMGHVGAIISGDDVTADKKRSILKQAGAHIADTPWEIVTICKSLIN